MMVRYVTSRHVMNERLRCHSSLQFYNALAMAESVASLGKFGESNGQLASSVDELSEIRKAHLIEVYDNVEGLEASEIIYHLDSMCPCLH